ncbi:unnamed protein product [Diatraea saccharalis]|uniref:Uncharacterized protein n=1 Tax=Diatraea saccharalis TaxID=40085 RepID=A0A9N9W9B9_9NEOP|nr:unnamed protein product [Diatraea saccharalis]
MLVTLAVVFVISMASAQEHLALSTEVPSRPSQLPFLDLITGASTYYSDPVPIRKAYSDPYYVSCPKSDTLNSVANVLGSAAKIMLSAAAIAFLKLLGGKLLLFPLLLVFLSKIGLKLFLLWPMISKMMKYFKKKKKKGFKSRMIMDCSQRIACVIQRASKGWGSNLGAAATFTLVDDVDEDSSYTKALLSILAVMYLPPFEVRTVKSDRLPTFVNNQQFVGSQQLPTSKKIQQTQPIMHTNVSPPVSKPKVEKETLKPIDARNFTFNDLLEALNNIEDKKAGREVSRASEYDYQEYPTYDYQPSPYVYNRPSPYSYGYQKPAAYVHPTSVHHAGTKLSLKSDLGDFFKPLASKVTGKVSGLIGLVLALLTGSSPNDVELTGFKDIVINGIVKPLLIAKGGIKTLISKLTIPVIALLLINLEVLVTVWWLWEDCPHNTPPPYTYPKPSYGYNSYR